MKRDFRQVVNTIKRSEKDVDRVLDAARLQRHEGDGRRLSEETIRWILQGIFWLFLAAIGVSPLIFMIIFCTR